MEPAFIKSKARIADQFANSSLSDRAPLRSRSRAVRPLPPARAGSLCMVCTRRSVIRLRGLLGCLFLPAAPRVLNKTCKQADKAASKFMASALGQVTARLHHVPGGSICTQFRNNKS